MENLTNILLGFQIGFLGYAICYAFKIMKLPNTPTFPYRVAVIALSLMCFWRVEKIFHIFPDFIATIATFVITILWMMFFIKIYTLMKKKNG